MSHLGHKLSGGFPHRRWIIARLAAAALTLLVAVSGCNSSIAGQANASDEARQWAPFLPTEGNPDPSSEIEGVVRIEYTEPPQHAGPGQRVAYEQSPPFGGAHDQVWADCNGVVYDEPVRNEHMVHSLEHTAVWLAYHPDKIKGDALDKLTAKVDGEPYLMMSPYPDLDEPISLQSWGHQLKLSSPDDKRIDQFIFALRGNPYTAPEPGARCDTADPTAFDPSDPPPFEPSPPGPDAVPEDGG